MNKLCDITASFKLVSERRPTARQPQPSKDVACEFAFPRIISVGSFGFIILGGLRRFDRLLDAMMLAEVYDLAALD
jgi:hypothetical protein